jgi:hypothetical protein
MRRYVALVSVAAVAVTAAACGKSEQQKAAEAASQQLEQAAKSAEQGETAKSLEEMGKALGALAAGGDSNQKAVEPVSFKVLQAAFPELEGWQREKPTGEKMNSPVSFSQATVRYTKGDQSIEAKLVDSGFNQLLIAPLSMYLTAGYERETEDGYEKSTKVGDNPGWETWKSESKRGELNTVVGKRFILTLEGDNLPDTKPLHEFAKRVNLGGLK